MGCGAIINPSSPLVLNINQFTCGHIIGKGEFGVVKYCHYKHYKDFPLAIKQLSYQKILSHKSGFNFLFLELKILKLTSTHPSIISLKFAFHDNSSCYFVFENLKGGDLRYHLRNHEHFTEYGVGYLIHSIASALSFLHEHHILHRDIKPENILLDLTGRPYLTDFGISVIDTDHAIPISTSSSGTRCYSAPEVFSRSHQHSYQADYWSFGILTYELLFHERPFHDLCPSHLVHFVEVQYESLWEELNKPITNTDDNPVINWRHYQNQPILESALGSSSELSMIALRNHQFLLSSSSSSEAMESQKMNRPSSSIQDSLTLPSPFIIPIPQLTSAGKEITPSCHDFLSRLLDIRIPHRLGTISSQEFLEHPWFLDTLSITRERVLSNALSPEFVPDEAQVSSQIFLEFSENLFIPNLFPLESTPIKLSSQMKQQLHDEFNYISPVMMPYVLSSSPSHLPDDEFNTSTTNTRKSTAFTNIPYTPLAAAAAGAAATVGGRGGGGDSSSFTMAAPTAPVAPGAVISYQERPVLNKICSRLESFDDGDGEGDGLSECEPHEERESHKHSAKIVKDRTYGVSYSADYPASTNR
jgi:serine/threonine protein kinase